MLTGSALAAIDTVFPTESVWRGPVLDIHLHPRREGAMELDHLQGSGVSKAVLLTGMAAEDRAKGLVAHHPDRFLRFTNTDVREGDAVVRLRKSLKGGAIGRGDGQSGSALKGKCIARETLTALQSMATPDLFRTIVWEIGTKLLKISG